jgi:hypothetical protein
MQTQTKKPVPIAEAKAYGTAQGWTSYLGHVSKYGTFQHEYPVGRSEVGVASFIQPDSTPLVVVRVNGGDFGAQLHTSVIEARAIAAALLLAADAVEAAEVAALAHAPEAVPA